MICRLTETLKLFREATEMTYRSTENLKKSQKLTEKTKKSWEISSCFSRFQPVQITISKDDLWKPLRISSIFAWVSHFQHVQSVQEITPLYSVHAVIWIENKSVKIGTKITFSVILIDFQSFCPVLSVKKHVCKKKPITDITQTSKKFYCAKNLKKVSF